MTAPVRSLALRVAAILAGASAAAILSEVVLRTFDLAPSAAVVTVTSAQFARLPGILAPNQALRVRDIPALPYEVHTDSLGFRGPDFPRHKAPGEFRLLFAGDSFVFGDYVDDPETLPAQLELRLRHRCPNVRVVNAGLDGATIVDEARVVHHALALNPDFVLLMFVENDVDDLASKSQWAQLADNRAAKSRFPLSVAYPLLRRTALWNLAVKARKTWASRTAPHAGSAPTERARQEGLRARYRSELLALRDTLARRGVRFAFAAYPSHFSVYAARPELNEWVTRMASEAGLRTFNVLPRLRSTGLPPSALFLLPDDGHPAPIGYTTAARFLADSLQALPAFAAACARRPAGRP